MNKKIIALVAIAFACAVVSAQTTVVLQNGLNGYTGCEDASICHHGYDNVIDIDGNIDTTKPALNHEADVKLNIKMCHT